MNTFGKFLGHGSSSNTAAGNAPSVTSSTGLSFASTIGPPSGASTAMSAMSRLGGFMTKVPFPLGATAAAPTNKIERASHDGELTEYVYEHDRVDGGVLRPSVDPKRYGDASAAIGLGDDVFPTTTLPEGYEWTSEWEVDLFSNWASVDKDGWTYGADWTDVLKLAKEELSHATKHPNDAVRRRRHVRYYKKKDQGSRAEAEPETTTTWAAEQDLRMSDEDADDPFSRTAQKKQSGFRTMNFATRAGKDFTKDYANITDLGSLPWLVNAQDASAVQSDEAIREKTANLEERIKKAAEKSAAQEEALRAKHQKKLRDVALQQKKLSLLVEQYRKVKAEYDTLQANATELARVVDTLRKEATEKDILANEDQRAINAEMQAANQALEEKAKALVTARIRYKRDNKALGAAIQAAKQRLEAQEKTKAAGGDDPVAAELDEMVEKLTKLHSKVEAVKQHRLAIEEERKEMFSQVVEKKSDLRLQSKMKLEATLHEIDSKLEHLKQEQANLLKAYANKPEGELLKQLNNRRSDIRNEMSALKSRRAELVSHNAAPSAPRPQVAEL